MLVAAITEVLGVAGLLTTGWLALSWGLASLGAAVLCVRRRGTLAAVRQKQYLSPDPRLATLVGLAVVVAATVGMIALIAAPNDTDSMKYHLMRVVHWQQDANVGMFPSEYLPQLYQPPWAEYAILHLQALAGSDRLANLVQWFSFAGTGIGVSLIARRLGAGGGGQVLAAIAALTLPSAILQASTAQNADVVAFWIVCAVYFFLDLRGRPLVARRSPLADGLAGPGRRSPSDSESTPQPPPQRLRPPDGEGGTASDELRMANGDWRLLFLLGASAGLAVLTKGTAYIYLAPLAVWYLIWSMRALGTRMWLPTLALIAIIAALNAPFIARNVDLFGQAFGPEGAKYTNQVFGAGPLISNLVRNLALQAGTPSASINHALESGIDHLHAILGIGVSDARTTWRLHVFHVNPLSTRESTAGNPVQLILALLSLAGVGLVSALRRNRTLAVYALIALAGLLFFCLYLKWQPWNSRLQLPFLALCCPIIGVVACRMPGRWTVFAAGFLLLGSALPWVVDAESRPLFGVHGIFTLSRTDQYFASLPAIEPGYLTVARYIGQRRCADVGLDWGNVSYRFEYPLWVSLRAYAGERLHVEDVYSDNVSERLESRSPFSAFRPCAVVGIALPNAQPVSYHGSIYRSALKVGLVTLFLPSSYSRAPNG